MYEIDLVVTPSWAYVYGSGKVDAILDEALKVRNPQAYWQNKRRREIHSSIPMVDEYWRLYDRNAQKFPKGVIKRAVNSLSEAGYRVSISVDEVRHRPSQPIYYGKGLEDYSWQFEAADRFLENEFAVCEMPTRSGKTLVGLRIATAFVHSCPVLYLVNKQEAQLSVQEHWREHFDIAPVYDDVTENSGLHVVTYQTAHNRELSHFGFVIGDEIHGAGADTFFDALQRCESAWYRLGMSGTVTGRSDNKDLWIEGAAGPVYYTVPREVIIEAGLCADGEVWQVTASHDLEGVRGWQQLEKHGIINDYRNERLIQGAIAARSQLGGDGQILVMVRKHDHGERLAEQLSAALQLDVPYVSGQLSSSRREKLYEEFKSGKIPVAVASSIWSDSVTFPHVRVLVYAAGGKSAIQARQNLGRALTGGEDIIVVDAYDTGHRTLEKHSKKRAKAYEEDGYPVKIWRPEDA